MNIQFFHKRLVSKYVFQMGDINTVKTFLSSKGGTTIALQVPTLEQFNGFKITDPKIDDYGISTIELDVGMAKCSSDDNYNKKIGRQITKGRMQTIVFWATRHTDNEVVLVAAQSGLNIPKLVLRRSPEGNRIHFVDIK